MAAGESSGGTVLRRSFLQLFASGVLLALLGTRGRAALRSDVYAFSHGVASGDPLHDSVILWTRVSNAGGESLTLNWLVARDESMTDIVASGTVATDADRDYTVKVDARGLPSNALLYYRFAIGDSISPVGRTRTLLIMMSFQAVVIFSLLFINEITT